MALREGCGVVLRRSPPPAAALAPASLPRRDQSAGVVRVAGSRHAAWCARTPRRVVPVPQAAANAARLIIILGGDNHESVIAAGTACFNGGASLHLAVQTAASTAQEGGASRRQAALWAAEVALDIGSSVEEASQQARAIVVAQGGAADEAAAVALEVVSIAAGRPGGRAGGGILERGERGMGVVWTSARTHKRACLVVAGLTLRRAQTTARRHGHTVDSGGDAGTHRNYASVPLAAPLVVCRRQAGVGRRFPPIPVDRGAGAAASSPPAATAIARACGCPVSASTQQRHRRSWRRQWTQRPGRRQRQLGIP